MPRTAVTRRLGGDSGATRKRYSVRQKLNILEECSRLQRELNLSAAKSATVAGINAATLRDWTSQLPELRERVKKESAKKSFNNGPAGQLDSIKDELLMWMFGRRQQGVVVDVTHVVFKASSLLRTSFGLKSFEARFKAATHFVMRHDYVYRAKTNESTRAPEDVYAEATEFIALYRPSLAGGHRHKRWILNMDQTPLYFSYHQSKTLALRGTKTIHVRKTTDDTRRATAALTITASGESLPPMIIFKGSPKGRIVKTELATLDPTCFYRCQRAAWMDEDCMLTWVDLVLKKYLVDNPPPPGVVPVILLDSYHCHMMASVVGPIQVLGYEIIQIPGGCTGLCQPLDVGVNKPFKARVRAKWMDFMTETMERTGNVIHSPTRLDVSNWAAMVTREMNGLPMMRNAWRKTAYDWFLGEPQGGDAAVTVDEEEEHDDFEELLDDENDDYEEVDSDDDDDAVDDYDVLIN